MEIIILYNPTAKSDVREPDGKKFIWIVSDLSNEKIWKAQHHSKIDIFHVFSN